MAGFDLFTYIKRTKPFVIIPTSVIFYFLWIRSLFKFSSKYYNYIRNSWYQNAMNSNNLTSLPCYAFFSLGERSEGRLEAEKWSWVKCNSSQHNEQSLGVSRMWLSQPGVWQLLGWWSHCVQDLESPWPNFPRGRVMMTKEVQEQASSKNLTALHYPTQVEQDNEHFLQQFAQHRVPPLAPPPPTGTGAPGLYSISGRLE